GTREMRRDRQHGNNQREDDGEVYNTEEVVALLVGYAHYHNEQRERRRLTGGLGWSMVQVADQEDSREKHNPQAGEAREVGHHQDVDGATESEAECNRQEGGRDPKLWHDAKRHRKCIGENDELDRIRDVRHIKSDEPRQPQAREPSCDAREALGIERRWQERYRLVGPIDLRASEVLDVGDRLKEIARDLVDFLQMTAIEEER